MTKLRPELMAKFEPEVSKHMIANYLYHCNAQTPRYSLPSELCDANFTLHALMLSQRLIFTLIFLLYGSRAPMGLFYIFGCHINACIIMFTYSNIYLNKCIVCFLAGK